MTRQELTAYMEPILPADRESMDAARRRQEQAHTLRRDRDMER